MRKRVRKRVREKVRRRLLPHLFSTTICSICVAVALSGTPTMSTLGCIILDTYSKHSTVQYRTVKRVSCAVIVSCVSREWCTRNVIDGITCMTGEALLQY